MGPEELTRALGHEQAAAGSENPGAEDEADDWLPEQPDDEAEELLPEDAGLADAGQAHSAAPGAPDAAAAALAAPSEAAPTGGAQASAPQRPLLDYSSACWATLDGVDLLEEFALNDSLRGAWLCRRRGRRCD